MSGDGCRTVAGRRLFDGATPRGVRPWALCGLATVVVAAAMLVATQNEGWHRAPVVVFALAAPLLIWIDLAEHRLPDLVVLPLLLVLCPLTVAAALAMQQPGRIASAALGALIVSVLFAVLFVVAPASLGLGDVKLAPSVGLLLGWHGWEVVVVGIVAVFVLGCIHGLVEIVRLRRFRGVDVAFGPAMIVAPLVVCALVSG